MRVLLVFALLLGTMNRESFAQTMRIKAIPYLMEFENEVADYSVVADDHIRFSSPEKSDLFWSPDGGYVVNKSPRLLFRPESDFDLSARIELEFNANWDAGDLILYNDERHWAKFCYERDFRGDPRVVSVVCNGVADDSNAMKVSDDGIYFRIVGSTKGNKFGMYYSEDGDSWFPIRVFGLAQTDSLRIGFCAQSPVGGGTTVDFSEIQFREVPIKDWFQGK